MHATHVASAIELAAQERKAFEVGHRYLSEHSEETSTAPLEQCGKRSET
jgi:hypothetical protein